MLIVATSPIAHAAWAIDMEDDIAAHHYLKLRGAPAIKLTYLTYVSPTDGSFKDVNLLEVAAAERGGAAQWAVDADQRHSWVGW